MTADRVRNVWVSFTRLDRIAVIGATVWFLFFGTIAALKTPVNSFFPDSRQHYEYIRVLLSGHMPFMQNTKITQVQHQPPLYYVTSVPWAAIGEQFGSQGGVKAVRFWTLILGSGVIWLTALLARQLVPGSKYVPGVAALIVGMNPQFFVMSSQVNNDSLTSLLGSALILCLIRLILSWSISKRWNLGIGLLSMAAFMTKLNLWPLVAALLLVALLKQPRRWSTALRLLVPIALAGGWWLVRNMVLYGDPTAMTKIVEYFGAEQHRSWLTPSGVWTWSTLLFESYWARFRYFSAGLHYQDYAILKALTVVAMAGVALYAGMTWRKLTNPVRWAYVALVACVGAVAVGVFSYSLQFYQPQGRYLFPAQAVIAFFLALGLDAWAPRRLKPYLAGAVCIGLVSLTVAAMRIVK